MIELTQEQQIAQHYSACMDSVNLINAGKPEYMSDEDWTGTISRNKEHLRIMLAKNIFAGYDTAPLQAASVE